VEHTSTQDPLNPEGNDVGLMGPIDRDEAYMPEV
jgi:hypothetical protein